HTFNHHFCSRLRILAGIVHILSKQSGYKSPVATDGDVFTGESDRDGEASERLAQTCHNIVDERANRYSFGLQNNIRRLQPGGAQQTVCQLLQKIGLLFDKVYKLRLRTCEVSHGGEPAARSLDCG